MTADGGTPPLVVIAGPTGTGKSALSLDLAERLAARGVAAEVVNADAMQLYRGMDIGTAKLPVAERRGVPHHLLDVLDVTEQAAVAPYQRDARAVIDELRARGTVPLLTGGSGLYLSAVTHDLDFPGTDPRIRSALEADLETDGLDALVVRLEAVDPDAARDIDTANPRRVVRALEVVLATGQPFAATLPERTAPRIPTVSVFLDEADRTVLRERLARRAAAMFDAGLLEETRALVEVGLREGPTARRAIGYQQSLAVIDGVIDVEQAVADTAQATARYARRQRSWFNRDASLMRLPAGESATTDAVLAAIEQSVAP